LRAKLLLFFDIHKFLKQKMLPNLAFLLPIFVFLLGYEIRKIARSERFFLVWHFWCGFGTASLFGTFGAGLTLRVCLMFETSSLFELSNFQTSSLLPNLAQRAQTFKPGLRSY
jgi:hypothetical protein